MTEPYYQDNQVTLYHGDCLEIPAWLEADVLVTDPPFGVRWEQRGTYRPESGHRSGHHLGLTDVLAGDDGTTNLRDAVLAKWGMKPGICFGSWKVPRPECNKVLIWDKQGCFRVPLNAPFYTSHEEIYILGKGFRASSPPQRSVISTNEVRQNAAKIGHPTPKPVGLMELLIGRCPVGIIAEPFAGAGSTLIAARNQGRKAIGVEIEERYCELVARRLDQMCFDFEEPRMTVTPFNTDVVVSVTIRDSEFTIGGIQAFLDRARGIDEMPANAMVTVTLDDENPKTWILTASTGFRPHYAEDSAP